MIHICPLLKFHKYKQNSLCSKIPKDIDLIPCIKKSGRYWEKEIYRTSDMNGPFICMATNSIGQPIIN